MISLREIQWWRCTVNWIPRCCRLIYSHLSLVIPPSPCLPEPGREEVCAAREGSRQPNHGILHTISVPPSCAPGRFPSPFLSGPLLCPSLSLQPDTRPLCLLSRPRQDELAVQRRTPWDPSSSPRLHTPPRISDSSSWVSFCRGAPAFLRHPLLLVVHSMIWHVFLSFLSLLFLFVFSLFWIRRLVWSAPLRSKMTDLHKQNTYTGIIVI